MRLVLAVLGCVGGFGLGIAAERHRSGDELRAIQYEIDLLDAHVEILLLRCKALEREATELRVRTPNLSDESGL